MIFDYVKLALFLIILQVTCHLNRPKGKMKIIIEHTNKSDACESCTNKLVKDGNALSKLKFECHPHYLYNVQRTHIYSHFLPLCKQQPIRSEHRNIKNDEIRQEW